MTPVRVPDLVVERVHLGEATDAERALVLADADARERLASLPAQDAALLAALPVDEEVRRIEGRARTTAARAQPGANRAFSALLGPLLAAAVATLWVVVAPPTAPGTDPSSGGLEVTTAKGPAAPLLRVYRQQDAGKERLGAGAVARSGERVQIGVVPRGATHGLVLSIDGAGAVTVHLPPGGVGSTELGSASGGEILLPRAFELDDAPAFERFFLVSTNQGAVDVEGVVRAAQRLARSGDARTARLPISAPYRQTTFLLGKEEE